MRSFSVLLLFLFTYLLLLCLLTAIHRWGEWTMLMLGESVLSLLIVDVTETRGYYRTFFCGIVSITLLEFLHFRSQPHDPDDHALRRSKEGGIAFTFLMQMYSAALVILGTAYKMLLYEYVYEEEAEDSSYRRALFSGLSRFLAAGDAPKFDPEDRRQCVIRPSRGEGPRRLLLLT